MNKLKCICGSTKFFSKSEIDYIVCINCSRRYRVFERFLGNDKPVLERFKKEVHVAELQSNGKYGQWEFFKNEK